MRITVIYGCMFAGKTNLLIRKAKHYANKHGAAAVLVVKHALDTRYTQHTLCSHSGDEYPCVLVNSLTDIKNLISEHTKHVFIDEAQFFRNTQDFIDSMRLLKIQKLTFSGLDTDYMLRDFGEMPLLIGTADAVCPLHAVCADCDNPATTTHRKVQNSELILIGAEDMYEPLCGIHYLQKNKTF